MREEAYEFLEAQIKAVSAMRFQFSTRYSRRSPKLLSPRAIRFISHISCSSIMLDRFASSHE